MYSYGIYSFFIVHLCKPFFMPKTLNNSGLFLLFSNICGNSRILVSKTQQKLAMKMANACQRFSSIEIDN